MITSEEIIPIGQLAKPHGIKGEITATLDYDIDLTELSCIVVDIDNIFVPFFVNNIRPKSSETVIISLDDISDEKQAKEICGLTYYALRSDVEITDGLSDGGGYLADFIGFKIKDDSGHIIAEITGFDDTTENVLFICEAGGKTIYIPVADELVTDIDTQNKILTMTVPTGLLDL